MTNHTSLRPVSAAPGASSGAAGNPIAAIAGVQTQWLTPLVMAGLTAAERLFAFIARR